MDSLFSGIQSEELAYDVDGLSMRSRLFFPEGDGLKPGVLVFSDVFGLGDKVMADAAALAAAGYISLACDMYGEAKVLDPHADVFAWIDDFKSTPDRITGRAGMALEMLRRVNGVDRERVGAVGYCFGGSVALEFVRAGADVKGVVGLHCNLKPYRPSYSGLMKSKVLVLLGADDPLILPVERNAFEEEMRRCDVDWQLTLYGGVVHSFTNPHIGSHGNPHLARYDPVADRRARDHTLYFLNEVLR